MKTIDKFNKIEELCKALNWHDMASHEAELTNVGRMYNRGAMTDALKTWLEEAGVATDRTVDAKRISYRHPAYPTSRLHVELWDGKIKSALLEDVVWGKVTSLTGMIRKLEGELAMNRLVDRLRD